jgi:hypothetical protein
VGTIHFLVPHANIQSELPEIQAAYMSGIDGHIFPTRVSYEAGSLDFNKPTADSCKLNIAWPIPGWGRPIIRTASLSERQSTYILTVELARGKLSETKDQRAVWENSGMNVPPEYLTLEQEAFRFFRQAACHQDDINQATKLAEQSLSKSFQATELLLKAYVAQRMAFRRQKSNSSMVSLGCFITGDSVQEPWLEELSIGFSSVGVPLNWKLIEHSEGHVQWETADRLVEWCQEHRVMPYGGPLLDLSAEGLPSWLLYYQQDPTHMQDLICHYVESVTSRYLGKIRNWEIIARANSGGAPGFSEESRLTMAARVIDIARQIDDENQLFIRVDQPWGAYQGRGTHRLSPFQFVDALLRSGIGLTGVNLEIAMGYQMVGAGFRDLLDMSRLIDLWSTLGVPLYVTLAYPTSREVDAKANSRVKVTPDQWRLSWSDDSQAEWIDQVLPMLLAKQAIVGVFWSHIADGQQHFYPNSGFIRPDGTTRPSLSHFVNRNVIS